MCKGFLLDRGIEVFWKAFIEENNAGLDGAFRTIRLGAVFAVKDFSLPKMCIQFIDI